MSSMLSDFHGFLGPVSAKPFGLVEQARVLEGEVSVLGSHMKQEWKARGTHQPPT